MRLTVAGLIFLSLCSLARGQQISGEVESIGFNMNYRPECFTPMVIRIKPQPGMGGMYQIQVKQQDLNGDNVQFSRWASITGDDTSREQRFSMYFLPTPINQGLADPPHGHTLRELH